MGMTIDKHIEVLKDWDGYFIGHSSDDVNEALDVAIDTMRKYQLMQADYEARLKADLVAMLTEIQLEIEELWDNDPSYIEGVHDSKMVIQQKINSLKA